MPTVHPCRTALDYTGVSGMVCLLCLCGEKNKLSEWWCRNLRLMSTVWNLEADDAELCAAIIPLTCSLHSAFTQHSLDRTARIACLNHANMMPKSQFWLPMRFSGLLLIKSLSTVCVKWRPLHSGSNSFPARQWVKHRSWWMGEIKLCHLHCATPVRIVPKKADIHPQNQSLGKCGFHHFWTKS